MEKELFGRHRDGEQGIMMSAEGRLTAALWDCTAF
jgi:hypothetical protein